MEHRSYDQQADSNPSIGHTMAMMNYDQQHTNYTQMGGPDSAMSTMMMKMYFHFGLGDLVLMEGVVLDSSLKLWVACLVLFLGAILLEAIDYSRGYLSCQCERNRSDDEGATATTRQRSSQARLIDGDGAADCRQPATPPRTWSCCAGSTAAGATAVTGSSPTHSKSAGLKPRFFPVTTIDTPTKRLLQSGLQMVRTALALTLMLVTMTYNVCLIVPILLGSGVGFYIFYRPALDSKGAVCH